MKKIKIGLLFGGKSGEHEVSIQSAQSIVNALDRNKYELILIRIDKNGQWLLDNGRKINNILDTIKSIDVFFPIIHGTYGEDGSLQGFLEIIDATYVGAGVLGSAIGMDKDVMKRLLQQAHIPIANYFALKKNDINKTKLQEIIKKLEWPVFVKPANLGSSVGVTKAPDEITLRKAIDLAFQYDTKILLEEYISGREIECSVLGNNQPRASVPGEVIPQHEFYSYEAKYIDENGAQLEIPAKLDKQTLSKIQSLAVKTFQTLECSGLARVDFFLKENKDILVNEINTLPGFTNISMYPKLWEASGLSYSKLLDQLIQLAIEKQKEKTALKRDFSSNLLS